MSAIGWTVATGPTGVTTWTSGPVQVTASRSGVVLRLILEPAKSRVHAVKTLDDLQRVVKSICDAVKTPAGQAIVDTLQEAFARHQHLAICHRLRQRKAAFA